MTAEGHLSGRGFLGLHLASESKLDSRNCPQRDHSPRDDLNVGVTLHNGSRLRLFFGTSPATDKSFSVKTLSNTLDPNTFHAWVDQDPSWW